MGFADGDFPHAEQYYQEAISIPLFHAMTDEQQLQVATSLRRILI
jgi:dTDP-4-amino-4,6-dideoxygalactose transaminase